MPVVVIAPALGFEPADVAAKPAEATLDAKPTKLGDEAKLLPTMDDDDFTPEESNSRDLPITTDGAAKSTPATSPEPVARPAPEPVAKPATEPLATKPDKKKLAIIAAAGGLLLILILYFATRGGGDTKEPPKLPPQPVVDPPKLVVDPPTPDAAVAIEPDAAEPAGSASEPAGAGSTVTDAGSGSATDAGSGSAIKKRPKYVPPPKKKWNPDELFIKP